MSNYGRDKPFYAARATAFSALMGTAPGYFGSTPKQSEPGPGARRAAARLAAHRKAQAEYLGPHADTVVMTRQLRRQIARLGAKGSLQLHLQGMTAKQRRYIGL